MIPWTARFEDSRLLNLQPAVWPDMLDVPHVRFAMLDGHASTVPPVDRTRVFLARGLCLIGCMVGLAPWLGCGHAPNPTTPNRPTVAADGGGSPVDETGTTTDRVEAVSDAATASRLRDLSFDDVKLEMERGDPFSTDLIPKRVTSLDGSRIRIRGYILPSFQQTGLTHFVLVRDNMECCFGPGAMLHDCIVVRMLPGRSASFSVRPVAVTGTFRLEELRAPDGTYLAIYAMDGEMVH